MKRLGNAVKLLAVAVLSLLIVAALTGCGSKKSNPPGTKTYSQDQSLGNAGKVKVATDKGFNAEQQAVIDKITEFADATQAKEYKKICQDLLSKNSQQLGGDCVGTLSKTGAAIKDFSIKVTNVTIGTDGKTATVDAVTTTNGQSNNSAPMTLAKDSKGQWRITILGQ